MEQFEAFMEKHISDAAEQMDDKLSDVSEQMDGKMTEICGQMDGSLSESTTQMNAMLEKTGHKLEEKLEEVRAALEKNLASVKEQMNDRMLGLNTEVEKQINLLQDGIGEYRNSLEELEQQVTETIHAEEEKSLNSIRKSLNGVKGLAVFAIIDCVLLVVILLHMLGVF